MEDKQALDIGLRFVLSDQPVDNWRRPSELLRIDFSTLARKANDVEDYAATLTGMVFSNQDIAKFYTESRSAAQGRPIHLRLNLGARPPSALHEVRWELLRDPIAGHPIATADGILFSRYLDSADFRLVPWRTKQASRALVVISGPTDLDEYARGGRRLAKVEVDLERSYAHAALDGIETVYLAEPGKATLDNLARELEQEIDILYLVCHGGINSDVPFVLLEKKDGTADPIDGRRLAEMVFERAERPTLAVLSSCQSAGEGGISTTADNGVLAGLGPRLAGAGIATVIAMQGNVAMETAQLFTKTFFAELRRDGMVDRAVAIARRSLKEQNHQDWWVPSLFSRLRTGRTYFRAEFTENGDETWSALESSYQTGRFTPILGPGMTDEILGSREAIAQRWADRWRMPIASQNRADLARVAQYLRVQQKYAGNVVNRVVEYLREEIDERIKGAAQDDVFFELDPDAKPEQTIIKAGERLLQNPESAYRVAAAMPVPVFVTTNWTLLLEQALKAQTPEKRPKTVYFPWNSAGDWPETIYNDEPTVTEPLVYHLFGRLDDPDSLVLTEDDYFEWLTAWVANLHDKTKVPDLLKKRLIGRSLLFLGYHLDDWEFRAVFQAINSIPKSQELLPKNKHVGVQLSPGCQEVQPEAAQEYLESYFGNHQVSIYWADTKKFLDEYRRRMRMQT